ncbi:hypothetical protein ACIP5Y_42530 [Nocardia sp. NPDC088792]|uniref:hypothetical protein n=1 Tax=Nocardia sp. NPDC088792 TaxID=3364332 RepID=UPI0037F871F9
MLQQEDPRFAELSGHDAYPAIRAVVAAYIIETIADPTNTHPHLWNVSALPSTSKSKGMRRLLTLNCSGLETLYVTEYRQAGGIAVEITINVDVPAGWTDERLHRESEGVWTVRPDYRSIRVWAWNLDLAALVDGDIDFESLTGEHDFEQLAAQLNEGLMRRGKSPYARYHSAALAHDLLAEVKQILAEENESRPA